MEETKVRFKHYRKVSRREVKEMVEDADVTSQINRYAGFGLVFKDVLCASAVTVCDIITSTDEKLVSRGYAFCGPRDTFSRKRGREVAEKRARELAGSKQ
jgi:hypothetical protein